MVFMISPQDAQAIQEDEAQLVFALAQVSQRMASALNGHATGSPATDSLRIQMGKRVVYGHLADGTLRRELDANRIKVILDAIQRPVTAGNSPEPYVGKVPALEIRDGETVLFREERDGTVTVNHIQLQIGNEQFPVGGDPQPYRPEPEILDVAGRSAEEQLPAGVDPREPENLAQEADASGLTLEKAYQVLEMAQTLINPYGDNEPLYDTVSIGGYRITQQGAHLTVSARDTVILVARDGAIISHQLQPDDWGMLQQMQARVLYARYAQDGQDVPKATAAIAEPESVPSAIAVLDRQTTQLPASAAKAFLQATLHDWRQQASQLMAKVEALQNQRLASAGLELFQRGHLRTGESAYQVGEFTLKQTGNNTYSLRDRRGELLQFQRLTRLGWGRRVQVLSMSDLLTDFHRTTLQAMRRNRSLMPQGQLDVEATYAMKTQQVEHAVTGFLQHYAQATVWDKDGGRFKLEMGADDFLRITDKQGRGVVFQRQQGEVFSRLTAGDFTHFDRLKQRMQTYQQSTAKKAEVEIG